MDTKLQHALEIYAKEIRIGIVEQIQARGFGHIGGSLSIADALAVLYGNVMRIRPEDAKWADRDRFVSSKGHAGPAVYAALALKGYFPYEELKTLNQPGTNLPSHCDMNKTNGVDMTTGSLGQGTSLACGLALGNRIKGRDSRVFLMVGDGELDEGQCWEAAMFTAAKKLTNLVWMIDWNKKQLDGYVDDIIKPFDLRAKFEAFGFNAIEIDGNDIAQLYDALTAAPGERPLALILNTVKGKGVPEVENTLSNHSMSPKPEQMEKWLTDLRSELAELKGGASK